MVSNNSPCFQIIKLIFIASSLKLSDQSCLVNTWCRPSVSSPFPVAEYKFVVTERMNWFQALHLCRSEGNYSELLSLDSADERQWVLQVVNSGEFRDYAATGEYSWHVNAHEYLYSTRYAAWANGRAIDAAFDRESGFFAITKSTAYCSGSRTVWRECYSISLFYAAASWRLENIDCNHNEIQRAICKRPLQQSQSSSTRTDSFKVSEWIQSPINNSSFYQIINVEQNCKSLSNWYCARLLCSQLDASLTDIVDHTDNDWLMSQIISSYSREGLFSEAFYYVDLHRLLYSNNWTWGGPHQNSSFHVSLNSTLSQEACPELCAAFRYSGGPPESISLTSVYCATKATQARAVCKKDMSKPLVLASKDAASVPVDSVMATFPASASETNQPAPDWFQSTKKLLADVPHKIILLGCCVAMIIVLLCIATFFYLRRPTQRARALLHAIDNGSWRRGATNEATENGQTRIEGENIYERARQSNGADPQSNTHELAAYAVIQ